MGFPLLVARTYTKIECAQAERKPVPLMQTATSHRHAWSHFPNQPPARRMRKQIYTSAALAKVFPNTAHGPFHVFCRIRNKRKQTIASA